MSEKNNFFEWLKEKLAALNNRPPEMKGKRLNYLLILLVVGALFMIIGSLYRLDNKPGSEPVTNPVDTTDAIETIGANKGSINNEMRLIEEHYENQLKQALEDIVGVHSVTVVVNVESTEKKVLEKNTILRSQTTREEDNAGGVRQIEDQSKEEELVIIQNGNQEGPIVLEIKKPEIKGVLVVAGGAENIQVQKWIIEAVTRVLDIPSHRVAVIPKKSKGES